MRRLGRSQSSTRNVSAHLSPELRARYKRRSIRVRVGDSVKIARGDFTGIEGKVTDVDTKCGRVYVEGVTREKASGGSALVPVHSSKIVITTLNLSDRWRTGKLTTEQALGGGTQEKEGEK